MKLPLHLAKKLQQLKAEGFLPASSLNSGFSESLLSNGLLIKEPLGRMRYRLKLKEPKTLNSYLQNHYGVFDLDEYVKGLENETLQGYEAVSLAADSKV